MFTNIYWCDNILKSKNIPNYIRDFATEIKRNNT